MDTLIEKIRSAFGEVAYPGDDALTDSFGEEADALRVEQALENYWLKHEAEINKRY